MKIEQFSKIKNHRVFHSFKWEKNLDNFDRYNLIFGLNGSGKSTLSNLFRAIEKQTIVKEGEVELVVFRKQNFLC